MASISSNAAEYMLAEEVKSSSSQEANPRGNSSSRSNNSGRTGEKLRAQLHSSPPALIPPHPAQGASDFKLKRSKEPPFPVTAPLLFFSVCTVSKRDAGMRVCGASMWRGRGAHGRRATRSQALGFNCAETVSFFKNHV